MSSGSSKRLAESLREVGHKTLRVYPNRAYRPQQDDIIINWGSSRIPDWECLNIINQPYAVGVAAHKIDTFYRLGQAQVPIPDYATSSDMPYYWLEEGETVIARTLVTSHAGRGIITIHNEEEFVEAPLYTRFFPKTHEYRVHIFQGDILDITEKRKRNGTGSREQSIIWNHDNEYVFCREDVVCPWDVLDASLRAVEALQLDFGAVDVGYDREHNQVAVFEVNTAPGLVGTTLNKYVEKLNDLSSR
jgi:hypothetical protein